MQRIEKLKIQLDTVDSLVARLKKRRTFDAEDERTVVRFKRSIAHSIVDLFVLHLHREGLKKDACMVQRACHGANATDDEDMLDHIVKVLLCNHIYDLTIEQCLTSFVAHWFQVETCSKSD